MHRWVNPGQAAHWEQRRCYRPPDHPAARAFVIPKLEWVCEQLDIGADSRVLDVGAGNGMFTYWWSERVGEVVGLERSAKMIERSPCRELLRRGDALELPFEDDSFDLVFAGNLLHHLEHPDHALREMTRVSRGGIAICEGNRNHAPMAIFGLSSRVCRGLLSYSRRTMTQLALDCGIDVVAVRLQGFVYENRSMAWSLPVAGRLEKTLPGGAYILLAGRVRTDNAIAS
jgi:SAM-dependent methyltransferase